jgi:SsrA-binding protein
MSLAVENRRARFDYAIESDLEVGLVLQGSEVKGLRKGGANIAESYAAVEDGELWLVNSYVPLPDTAVTFGHEPRRRRKLLASRREIAKLWQATSRQGLTLVPLKLYANERGVFKLKLAVAKGKTHSDKRETSAKRDWQRQKSRLLKAAG